MKRAVGILLVVIMCVALYGCQCKHIYTAATCTVPATCTKCGETNGEALGHEWTDATCATAKTCTRCGAKDGEPLQHIWDEATCETAKKCELCGATDGEPLGHKWKPATCTEPAICSVCGKTEGDPAGHSVSEWSIVSESTCSVAGIREGFCKNCGETVKAELSLRDHTPSEWIITVPATKDSDGTHVKQCIECGAELESESFTMTEEEIEEQFKSMCSYISYEDLLRNPGAHKGEYIELSGTVFQVVSEAKNELYLSAYFVKSGNNITLVMIDNFGAPSRILEDDYITVWGTVDDLYTYETIRGNSNTIPQIRAEYWQ